MLTRVDVYRLLSASDRSTVETMADTRPEIPAPPFPLWQMTTTELDDYEAELTRVLRLVLDDATRTLVADKLDEIDRQRESRQHLAETGHQKNWPLHN